MNSMAHAQQLSAKKDGQGAKVLAMELKSNKVNDTVQSVQHVTNYSKKTLPETSEKSEHRASLGYVALALAAGLFIVGMGYKKRKN